MNSTELKTTAEAGLDVPCGNKSLVKPRTGMFFILGCVTMGLLHLQFVLFWHRYYLLYPSAEGHVPPFFLNSILSFAITMLALFALPLVALWFARGRRWLSALAIWSGVMFATILIVMGTASMRQDLNLWPIDLAVVSLATAVPITLGSALNLLLQKVLK